MPALPSARNDQSSDLGNQSWISLLAQATAAVPSVVLVSLAMRFEELGASRNARDRDIEHAIGASLPPSLRAQVLSAFNSVLKAPAPPSPAEIALVLRCVAATVCVIQEQKEQVELVWTGPGQELSPLRRTEQALLDVVRSATQELWIVSFAVYPVQEIVRSLREATQRGTRVNLVFETCGSEDGRVGLSGADCLGEELVAACSVYEWPVEHRGLSADGRSGLLHAKCAVADGTAAFVSSANLTSKAMTQNMELGLLVRGGETPRKLQKHFQRLVADSVLVLRD